MRTKITTHLTKKLIVAAAVSLLGSAVAVADVPGYEFMMFPEGMAMVVDSTGKATKAKISEDTAKAITAGAQPLSQNAYKVQLAKVAVKRALQQAAGKA